jgi:hypothetical protein
VRNYVGIKENPVKIVEIIDKKMDGNYDMKSITIVAKVALITFKNKYIKN